MHANCFVHIFIPFNGFAIIQYVFIVVQRNIYVRDLCIYGKQTNFVCHKLNAHSKDIKVAVYSPLSF